MNVVTRGMRNALRSPVRSGAIVIMLAISISLIMAMLVARTSVNQKINEVKSTNATGVTIRPAGFMGGMGGGDPLTADQVNSIKNASHIASTSSTLTDQLGSEDTNLTPSLELGKIGERMQRFESSDAAPAGPIIIHGDSASGERTPPKPRTTVTGTTDPHSIVTDGSTLKLTSGATIDGNSSELVALVGKTLAQKNNLSVGSTFTAYGKTFTVKGIFETGNKFQDSGMIVPLATLQAATEQAGAVTSVAAKVDSAENVTSTVAALKSALGDKADITSQQEQAASSVGSLESIASIATTGVIGATIAASVIVLLTMTMIVRERKREIGVVKAIGGTNFKVVTQFIAEALTLTVIGGVIGIALGVAISGGMTDSLIKNSDDGQPKAMQSGGSAGGPVRMIGGPAGHIDQNVRNITSTVTPEAFGLAAGSLLLIAILGSALPAWLIARVRPAEVLRSE